VGAIVISVRAVRAGWRLGCPLLPNHLLFGSRDTAETKAHCLASSLAAIGREVEVRVYDATASIVSCLALSPAGRRAADPRGAASALAEVVPFPPHYRIV
jgi:hypothetical protein